MRKDLWEALSDGDVDRVAGCIKADSKRVDEVFTEFEPALLSITQPSPGRIDDFIKLLQEKLDDQIETPPVNNTIEKPF